MFLYSIKNNFTERGLHHCSRKSSLDSVRVCLWLHCSWLECTHYLTRLASCQLPDSHCEIWYTPAGNNPNLIVPQTFLFLSAFLCLAFNLKWVLMTCQSFVSGWTDLNFARPAKCHRDLFPETWSRVCLLPRWPEVYIHMWWDVKWGEKEVRKREHGDSHKKSSQLFSERKDVMWGRNMLGERRTESKGLEEGETELRMRTGRDRRGQRDGRRQKNLLPSHS